MYCTGLIGCSALIFMNILIFTFISYVLYSEYRGDLLYTGNTTLTFKLERRRKESTHFFPVSGSSLLRTLRSACVSDSSIHFVLFSRADNPLQKTREAANVQMRTGTVWGPHDTWQNTRLTEEDVQCATFSWEQQTRFMYFSNSLDFTGILVHSAYLFKQSGLYIVLQHMRNQ